MAIYDFLCIECGEQFATELEHEPGSGAVPCPVCHSTHVRQTFASYLRNALARPKVDIEELRACHRG